jgi:hypothetical protein
MYRSLLRLGSGSSSVKFFHPLGIRKMVSEAVQTGATESTRRTPREYYLMGAILGGVGVGVPLYIMYVFSQYEVEWAKRLHPEDQNKKKV